MVAGNWVGKLIPFKEIKRSVAIIKLRKCELIKFSKLPYEVGPVATPFCIQGNKAQRGRNLPMVSLQCRADGASRRPFSSLKQRKCVPVLGACMFYNFLTPTLKGERSVLFFLN